MLTFKQVVRVLEVIPTYGRNDKYCLAVVKAANLEIKAKIVTNKNVIIEKGMCLSVKRAAVTRYDKESREVALILFDAIEITEDEYSRLCVLALEVICNGKLVKTDKAVIRQVMRCRKSVDCLPCTLSVKIEDGNMFNLFLVCYDSCAVLVNDIERGTFINVKATLCKNKKEDFELIAREVTLAQKKLK